MQPIQQAENGSDAAGEDYGRMAARQIGAPPCRCSVQADKWAATTEERSNTALSMTFPVVDARANWVVTGAEGDIHRLGPTYLASLIGSDPSGCYPSG